MSANQSILTTQFITAYKKQMMAEIMSIEPSWDIYDVEEVVNEMILENFQNPHVILDNNYRNEQIESTLLSVFEWALTTKPIIAGNGTFYKNQNQAYNPIANMLRGFLSRRDDFKRLMYAVDDSLSRKYRNYDLKQTNVKKLANSYYGSSGAKISAFYSTWSGPATTLTAQSVISTAENFFETFLVDNYAYANLNDLMHWCHLVIQTEYKTQLDDFVQIPSSEDLITRLLSKIIYPKKHDEEIITRFVYNLTTTERTILFYKNNLIHFISVHPCIQRLFRTILSKIPNGEYASSDEEAYRLYGMDKKSWNKKVDNDYFMNPNSAPDPIRAELNVFKDIIMKYIFVPYMSFDRIYRLRNFKRNVVTVIDTDSNILSIDILVNWLKENVIRNDTFGRDDVHNDFAIVNTITYVITEAIQTILLTYGKHSNVPEEYRSGYKMKNEFFMDILIIGTAKKRYISRILLREGNLMNPPKKDVKGFDFKKATCSEYAESQFMKIISQHIIESDYISLRNILQDLREFENEVRASILAGETFFLPNGSAKELAAYKDPASNQSVRGSLAWNALYPNNAITFPSKVALLKMTIYDEADAYELSKTHPEVYSVICDKIFGDTTGIFVTKKTSSEVLSYVNPKTVGDWTQYIPKKYRPRFKKKTIDDWNFFVDQYFDKGGDARLDTVDVKSRGLQVLAIPSNSRIPDWALPYVDINLMVNTIMSPFKGVLELFGDQFIEEGKSRKGVTRKAERYTNVLKF